MKSNRVLEISIFLLTSCYFTDSARILGVFPIAGGSHHILASQLMKGLGRAGHDITMITPFVTKNPPKNGTWKDVLLTGMEQEFEKIFKKVNLYDDSKQSSVEKIQAYAHMMLGWVNSTLYHPNVTALLDSDEKFDVVLTEQFMNDAHKVFAHLFKCPLILLSSTGPNPWINYLVGNPSPMSYIPHFFMEGDFSKGMSFFDRLLNLLFNLFDVLFRDYYALPLQDKVLQKAFPGVPNVNELNDYISLILLNSHISLIDPVPTVPNMVEIGGYHIEPPKGLPKDLQKFLDNAKDGVIYFSMGSNLKSKDMAEDRKKLLLNVFSKLKQKVLWKFEDEQLPGKPANVMIKSWMPQQDILAHPNIKLFITHGGLLSTTETIYHGVPILAIPVFADQFMNANRAVQMGFALKITYNDEHFSEQTLHQLIEELLNNPKYKETAQLRSKMYHDRPIKPMENAVYWVEYVIRHNGAYHLRVGGAKLPWYKYFMVDTILFLLSIVLVIVYSLKFIFKKIFMKNKNKKNSSSKQKTN